jgi:hypothetical protein
MLVRVVLIKLKPAFPSDASRRMVAEKSREVLPRAARVQSISIHLCADSRTEREWDLCLLVRFESIEDTEVYRTDPVHRAYADVFLKPMLDEIRVLHFEDHTSAAGTGSNAEA